MQDKINLLDKDTDYGDRGRITGMGMTDYDKAKLSGMSSVEARFYTSNPYTKKQKLSKKSLGLDPIDKSLPN